MASLQVKREDIYGQVGGFHKKVDVCSAAHVILEWPDNTA